MAILCNLQNIHLSFGTKDIFSNASFTIHKGDRIGLIGLNGKGKSTLFHILTEEIIPDISTPSFLYDKSQKDFGIFHVPQELPIDKFPELNTEKFYLAFTQNCIPYTGN